MSERNYSEYGSITIGYKDGSEINAFVPLSNIGIARNQIIKSEDLERVIESDRTWERRK